MRVSRDRAPGRMSSMSGADVCFRKLGADNRWEEDRNGSGGDQRVAVEGIQRKMMEENGGSDSGEK